MRLRWAFDNRDALPACADGEFMIQLSELRARQSILTAMRTQLKQKEGKIRLARRFAFLLVLYALFFGIDWLIRIVAPGTRGDQMLLVFPLIFWMLAQYSSTFTHIKVSPEGLRFFRVGSTGVSGHTSPKFPWSSPLIPWTAIKRSDASEGIALRFASIASGRNRVAEIMTPASLKSLRVHVAVNELEKPRSVISQEGLLAFLQRRFWKPRANDISIFQIVPQAMDEGDLSQLIKALQTYLPAESLDPSLDELLPHKPWQNYTTIWLEQLNQTSSRNAPLPPGTVLKGPKDSFEVIERLGSGGQGVAYRAKRTSAEPSDDNEVIVLKEFVLPAGGGSEIMHKAFGNIRKEAELLQSLNHPNVVRCFGWFSSGRRAYLILSLINGQTMRKRVQETGPLSEEVVRSYAAKMCDLLEYLHSHNPPIVHRDFTPDNLMINEAGELFLMDFDVARRLESQTATHTVVGKPNYVPPEQFRGSATTQSDIYALGCTLHWLLTGEDPEPISVCHPAKVRPDVSEPLDSVVAKATAQDCADRYAGISELRSALEPSLVIKLEKKTPTMS